MTPTIGLVVLAVFAGASFFFALAETSLFSLGKWQLRAIGGAFSAQGGAHQPCCWPKPQDLVATLVLEQQFCKRGNCQW